MTTKKNLIVSFKSAKWIAITFFCIGTLLFLIQLLLGDAMEIAFLGMLYTAFAVLFNGTILLFLIIDLIRRDLLESFYGICLILANVPIAMGYVYLLLEFIK
ncbi:MAG: hypothetical protein Aureis2KO_29610 [Aureisphaera sp.]